MQKLSSEKVGLIIELVKRRPPLYDRNTRLYRNSIERARCWKEVAEYASVDVKNCKAVWKSLRDQYLKSLRDTKTSTGKAQWKKRGYKYSQQLEFLNDSLQPKESTAGNFKPADVEFCVVNDDQTLGSWDDSVNFDTAPSSSRTRSCSSSPRFCTEIEAEDDDEDDDDSIKEFLNDDVPNSTKAEISPQNDPDGLYSFFQSMASTLYSFKIPPLELLEIKNNIHGCCFQQVKAWHEKSNKYR